MTSPIRTSGAAPDLARWSVVLLFIGSGCAALMYELVWFHLLRLVIGSSYISLGILLASFMGGMCLGSFALARMVSERHHPLRVYAALELAIGVFGATLPWWLPWLNDWYLSVASESLSDIWARSVVAAAAVIPATFLMGATLPAVARWVKATPDGLAQLGVFYGANTFGAVIGCLFAGFVLLPQTDVVITSYVAAGINLAVAVLAWLIARNSEYTPAAATNDAMAGERVNANGWVCLVAALSGFTALAAEVVWTRMLAPQFASTVYTFALILAVFLTGLGLGSVAASYLIRRLRQPLLCLAIAQFAVVCCIPIANYVITRVLPYWPRPVVYEVSNIYAVFVHDMWRTVAAVMPSTFLWGASFPLAIASAGSGQRDTGRLVGQVYAANTCGAIFGSLATGSWLIPTISSQRTLQVIAASAAVAAVICIILNWRTSQSSPRSGSDAGGTGAPPPHFKFPVLALAVFVVASSIAVALIAAPPQGFLGRSMRPGLWRKFDILYQREGASTPVVVESDFEDTVRVICIGGKACGSSTPVDMRSQRLLGHLAALIHPAPKKTLTVGMGTATTSGCFVLHPEIQENIICEIEPAVCEAAEKYFSEQNHDVIQNERTRIQIDDARHFLAVTDEKFDIITAAPINTWIRGTATLYSAEYFQLCKKRLNPGGILVQWISLYEKDLATAKCELATFLDAFPNAMLWTSWKESDGYETNPDIIAIGRLTPGPIDLEAINRRIQENPALQASLAEVDVGTIPELFGQFAGYGEDLRNWLADAEINRDRSLRLEYLAGMSLFLDRAHLIFEQLAAIRHYPSDLFQNDGSFAAEIRERLLPPE